MKSKKIISALVVVGIIGAVVIGYNAYTKLNNSENIKQEVVYTSSNTLGESKDSFKLTHDEEEEYKELSKQVLKRYFDIQDDDYTDFMFNASRISEKTLTEMQEDMKKTLKESYDNNKISKEEYEKQMEKCNGEGKNSIEEAKKSIRDLKHNVISVAWVGKDKNYAMHFNASTNEIDNVITLNNEESGTELNLSEEELKITADNFIKDKEVCNIENIDIKNIEKSEVSNDYGNKVMNTWNITYNDKNDDSKKVVIEINAYTGKVQAFILSQYK